MVKIEFGEIVGNMKWPIGMKDAIKKSDNRQKVY